MDPVTIGMGIYAGKAIGSTIAGWITPNKSPWERYQEKIGWIAGSKPPGALSNDEIRSVVHSTPTIGADLSTMNSAADSAGAQMTALKDNRAVVESVSNTLHTVNANLRLIDAKKRLSGSLESLRGSTRQAEMNTNWKKGMMGIAAERSVDEWEAKNEQIGTIGGMIGGGLLGLHMGAAQLLGKSAGIVGGGVQGGANVAMGAAEAGGTAGLSLGTGMTEGVGIGALRGRLAAKALYFGG